MRTTPDENERMGRWIGERLNQMDAPVRFLLPEGGVSALDAPGQPFHDQAADAALFRALEADRAADVDAAAHPRPAHINDPAFRRRARTPSARCTAAASRRRAR